MAIKIVEDSQKLIIQSDGYAAEIDLLELLLHARCASETFDFELNGNVHWRAAESHADQAVDDGAFAFSAYTINGNTLLVTTKSVQTETMKTIELAFFDTYFTYRLIYVPGDKRLIESVDYAASMDEQGNTRFSQANFEEFFIWCPDRYQSILPFNQEAELRLSSTRLPEEGFFRGDVGKYLAPPYIAALRSGAAWIGLATLEVPASQLGLHVIVDRQCYHLNFRYSGNLTAGAEKPASLPKIGFYFGASRDETLSSYIDSLCDRGLVSAPTSWHSWWAGPMYCTYADQVYQHTIDSGIMKDEPGASANCSEAFVSERLQILDEHHIPYGIVTLDYAWMEKLGDYTPHPERFGDLRAFIDGMHQKGKHVLLWFAPFFCESESELARSHPDWMIKAADGSIHSHIWMKKTIYTPDFTHPGVRDYFTRLVKKILGSGEGEFNADGFKIDGYSFLPDVSSVFFDPGWGAGDLFQYKADKLIYEAAKVVKADALVEQSFANPLFNDVQDVCRLDDASSYDTDLYENRAWVALSSRVALPDTDDWSAFKKMFIHSTLRKAVYGIPTLYAIKYRGTGRMGGASGGYPVPISEDDYSRVSAILRMCQKSPIDQTQERFVDPENKVFWRKYTSGKLAGFYAAAALAGNTVFAAFTEEVIYLAAIVETQPLVPLPPGSSVVSVKEIHKDGANLEPRNVVLEDVVLLWMKPSTGLLDHYEIELEQE